MDGGDRSHWNAAPDIRARAPETARRYCLGVLGLALVCAASAPAPAATLFWDINGNTAGLGGTGTWNTTSVFWNSSATGTGGTVSAWNNGNIDSANFAGTAGTVTLGGVPITVGNVTFSTTGYALTGSTLTLGGATPTITSNPAVSATIASIVDGTAGLAKAGTGTLTLNGANTFSGGINVTAGILSVNGNAALGNASNAVTMANGTQLSSTGALASSRVVTLSGGNVTLSGAGVGSARFTGAGGVIVQAGVNLRNNANDYTGQTQFSGTAGTYSFSSIGDLGVASALGAPTTVANGTVRLAATSGAANLTYTGTGGSSNRNFVLQNNGGLVRLRNAGSGTLTLTGDISLSGTGNVNTITFDATSGDLALLGVISNVVSRSVTLTGSTGRTITLGGANTWSGAGIISGVTVFAPVLANQGVASSIGTAAANNLASANNVNSNGKVSYTGVGASSNRGWLINNGTISNDGTGALALSGVMAITNTATLGGNFSGVANSASGVISGTGTLAINGAGTWALTNTNTYSGGTTIAAGTLRLGDGGTSGSIVGDVTNNGALAFNRSDSVVYGGVVAGSGSLSQIGTGTTILMGDSLYTGGTTISAGTLQIASDANLGDAAGGLAFTNNGTLHTTASIATGRSINFAAGIGTLETDAGTSLTLTGALTGAGGLRKEGDGTLLLSGSDTHSGETIVGAGTLAAGAANAWSSTSAYTVLNGATLDLRGYDQTIATLANAGLVRFTALGRTLTVIGDYVGNGGTLALETALGTDSSVTDLLRVGGSTSGSSTLQVSNAGGTGGQTVEGIKIVDVAGASNGTFALAGDFVTTTGEPAVIGGAYAYTLHKNGVSTPADGDWYLRSQAQFPVNPDNPVTPGNPTEPSTPPTPLFQPGVPLYESYGQVLLGLNGLPTLQQRVGDRYWSGAGNAQVEEGDGPGVAAPVAEGGKALINQNGVWARIAAAHTKIDPETSTSVASYDYDVWQLLSGVDGKLYENDSGMLIGGITAQYGQISADVSSVFGTGSIDTDGYGLGATLTFYGDTGFYADGQAQVAWYDSDLSSNELGSLVDGNGGFGYALSAEAGQRVGLDPHWTLTPQAQLVYSAVDFDSFTDPFGARVSLDGGDSLQGRLGLAADYQNAWADAQGRLTRTSLYGIANLYYQFLDGIKVDVATTNFTSASERLWGGLGAGGSYTWADDKYALYGEVSLNTSLAAFADSYSANGTVGFRVKF